MIDPALRASLAAFDDAALATLANAGLVRRAHRDVAEGKVMLVDASVGRAVIEADGQRVELDNRGPKAAPCACKSAAMCRHRLAAVLFILSADATADEAAEDAPAAPMDVAAEFDLARAEKWAGKAAWRAALELAGTASGVEEAGQSLSVCFPDLDGPVLLLRGQGMEGIVSKASKARLKAVHAAAVLAALRHAGLAVPDAPAEAPAEEPASWDVDPEFLQAVRTSLAEVAMLGFNLAPLPLEEALFALSVSSRADSLPRLAALLRAIAAQMRLRRARSFDFDPDRMLELAATANALTLAIGQAGPERRTALAGKVRRDFAPSAPLKLVGCGGERWQAVSGARGVTAWFVDPENGQWLSTTLARGPGQDPAFMPGEAWRTQSLWQSEPLEKLAHARITLEGANRSSDHRLSAPASARAHIVTRDICADGDWSFVVRHWSALRQHWLEQAGLGLDHGEAASVCLIAPQRIAPPYFDELTQQLIWPVSDEAGEWLGLALDHQDGASSAIDALEANVRTGWKGLVLVRMDRVGDRLALRPVTLFSQGQSVDLSLWIASWSAGAKASGKVRDWLERLRASSARFVEQPRSITDGALAGAWRHLLDIAELGPALAKTKTQEGAAHAERLDSFGLATLAGLLRDGADGGALLKAAYGVMLARTQRCRIPLLQPV